MKTRLLRGSLLLLLLAGSSAFADARKHVDETRNAAADGFVKIQVVRGKLQVEGWDKNEIRVSGELDSQTKDFVFDVDKDDARIEVRLPQGMHSWCCDEGSDLVVQVPRNSHLDIAVVSTDTRVRDIEGGLEMGGVSGDLRVDSVRDKIDVTSVSGSVDVRDSTGRIDLKSVSGDVEVYDSKGEFRLNSVSGDIVARNVSNEFDLQTVSGDIEADTTGFSQVTGNSVSGDVDIKGKMSPGGNVDFESVSGSVRVEFDGDVDARFDLAAGSGSIRNRLTSDKPAVSKYSRDESLRFIKGEGKGEVNINTRSGDIVISD